MAEKRKSVFKRPSRRRRNRSSTPVPDLLSPYLPGPELFISSPLSAVQTRPVHSSAAVVSSPRGAFVSPIGHVPYSGSNPTLSFDSNPNLSKLQCISHRIWCCPRSLKQIDSTVCTSTTDRLVWALWVQFFIHRLYSVQSHDFHQ